MVYIHVVVYLSFNLFLDMPGCPPSWFSSSVDYCYILKRPIHGVTWLEAQKECSLVRSNLLTLTSANEYSSVAGTFDQMLNFIFLLNRSGTNFL